eukprot:scaffold74307_cov18-Tisochrysis_lutea.AAC.4
MPVVREALRVPDATSFNLAKGIQGSWYIKCAACPLGTILQFKSYIGCVSPKAHTPYSSEGRSWSCSSSKICLSRSMAGQGEGKGLAQGKLIAGPYAPHRCWSTTSTKHSSFKKKILSYPSTSLPTLGMGTLESKPSSVLLPGNACFWKTYICTISYKTNTHKVATKIAFYILSRSI